MQPQLRQYQNKCIDDLRASLRRCRASVLCLKTGLGKTVVAGNICRSLALNGLGALAMVHRRELVRQFCKTLDKHGLAGEYGVIQSGVAETPWAKFQVGSVQTMARRDLTHLRPRIIFVDEAHHVKASTWEKILKQFPNSLLVGLTATPARLDGKPLGDWFKEIVFGPTYDEAVEAGYLSKVETVYSKLPINLLKVRRQGGDYHKGDMAGQVSDKVVAHALKAWREHVVPAGFGSESGIFFGINIEHSKQVAAQFREAGVAAEHVDGTMSANERDSIMAAYEERRVKLLCNVDIISEGTDLPFCRYLLDCQPTMSVGRYKQKGGRIMRPNEDGGVSLHVDGAGSIWEFGKLQEEWRFSLERGAQDGPVEVLNPGSRFRACKECAHLYGYHRTTCPNCGTPAPPVLPPGQIDPKMTKLDEQTAHGALAATRSETRSELKKILALGSGPAARGALRDLAARSGYTQRWISNMQRYLGL